MKKVEFSGVILIVLCGVVLFGWMTGTEILTNLHAGWATMKPMTAMMCGVTGIMLLARRSPPTRVACAVGLMMAVLMSLTGLHGPDGEGGAWSTSPGMPSLATLSGFFMLALFGMESVSDTGRPIRSSVPAIIAALIGAAALIEYARGGSHPFSYPGISTAVAVHTGGALVLAGVAGFIQSRRR